MSVVWEGSSPEQRHVLMARALRARHVSARFVFSHSTAAALLGLPVPRKSLGSLATTVSPGPQRSTRYRTNLRQHVATLDDDDVTTVGALPTTGPARTVADCLRHLPAIDAVPIADAALHQGLTTLEEVRTVLRRQAIWPYCGVAGASVRLVDGRRESPLESRSAVVMHRHELPPPEPQVIIYDRAGRFVAKVDFAWLSRGVVGEADGRGKYADQSDPVLVFEAEKERQARLEGLGLVVVRWNARLLWGDPPPLVARLRAALEAGSGRRFTGRAA